MYKYKESINFLLVPYFPPFFGGNALCGKVNLSFGVLKRRNK